MDKREKYLWYSEHLRSRVTSEWEPTIIRLVSVIVLTFKHMSIIFEILRLGWLSCVKAGYQFKLETLCIGN